MHKKFLQEHKAINSGLLCASCRKKGMVFTLYAFALFELFYNTYTHFMYRTHKLFT